MPLDGGSPAKAYTWDGGRKLRERGGKLREGGGSLKGQWLGEEEIRARVRGQVLNKIRVRERSEMAPFVSVGDFNRD